jgi:hypothetical protein
MVKSKREREKRKIKRACKEAGRIPLFAHAMMNDRALYSYPVPSEVGNPGTTRRKKNI